MLNFQISPKFDLQTTKYVNFLNQRAINFLFEIYENFDLHMRILNLQGLGAPDRP
jgi:hypothetical protein